MVSVKNNIKKFAIVSVSNKKNIDIFAKKLVQYGYTILSTGGTEKFLKKNNIPCLSISKFTNFDEILEGRVKTLHPKIHSGILAKNKKSLDLIKGKSYTLIDMVVVNLYPFKKIIQKKGSTFKDAIENIDIGGPTMLRAAAKNHARVTVVTDPEDYDGIINEIQKNNNTLPKTRLGLAIKVFKKISNYDSIIFNFLNKDKQHFPDTLDLNLEKLNDLRYGENPHQAAALYQIKGPNYNGFNFRQLSGKKLSFNNLVDAESSLACVKQFKEPSCVIVKHANPCGVAECKNIMSAYSNAYKTDPTSAFGGIIAFNRPVEKKLLKKILDQQFVEVIIAPKFMDSCLDFIKIKPNIRLLEIDNFNDKKISIELKSLESKLLIQEKDTKSINMKNLKCLSKKQPSKNQSEDLIFAFKVARYVKSNAIVFVKNKKTLGIGAGQMSRIDSTKIAQMKAKKNNISLQNCVMASEAFFPFRDNVDLAKKIGVVSIIQPGGSVKDSEIISVADKHKISMVFTGTRVFKH